MLQDSPPTRMLAFDNLDQWSRVDGVYERELDPEFQWNELVVSWNVVLPAGGEMVVSVRPEGAVTDYVLGRWSEKPTSVKDQKDEFARVSTDTLVLAGFGRKATLRVAFNHEPKVKLLAATFAIAGAGADPVGVPAVWGKVLEPPRRAQMSYPNGAVICSPTATSMALGYWAAKLERPELDHDVPTVCAGVFDPGWDGTGNWVFNTAFAGSVPGMRAYVARLWSVNQLERWIERDVPVVCSVSYSALKGEEKKKPNDGHLVVLVGFDPNGDPVFNDPGKNVVRMTYKRADFERAWASSGRTTYLIYPRHWRTPANTERAWVD